MKQQLSMKTSSSDDDDTEAGVLNILRKFGSTLSCMKDEKSSINSSDVISRKTRTQNPEELHTVNDFKPEMQSCEIDAPKDCSNKIQNISTEESGRKCHPMKIVVQGEFNWPGICHSLNRRVLENTTTLQSLRSHSLRRLGYQSNL